MSGEPSNIQAALSLAHQARTEFFQGDWINAEAHIRQSLEQNPRFAPAYDLLSSLLEQAGRFEESASVAREGLTVAPTSGSLYYHLVKSHRIGDHDLSLVSEIEEVIRVGQPAEQDSRYLHYALGKAFDDLCQYKEAMEHWDLANKFSHQLQFGGQAFDRKQYQSFFNRVCSVYSAEFLKQNSKIGSNSKMPILIVGMPRSGTTLVEQILSNHPEVAAGGELSYWMSQVGNHSAAIKANQPIPPNFARNVQTEYISALNHVAPSRPRVADKMPDNYMVLGWIHTLFPNAPIIHIRRNAADNCLSIYATPYSRPPRFAYGKDSIAFAYECYLKVMEYWRRILPVNAILDVKYEELVLNTEQTVRSMIEFCGLTWDDACLMPESNQRIVQTPSAWQVRQPINDRSISKWKHYEPWLGAIRELEGRKVFLAPCRSE